MGNTHKENVCKSNSWSIAFGTQENTYHTKNHFCSATLDKIGKRIFNHFNKFVWAAYFLLKTIHSSGVAVFPRETISYTICKAMHFPRMSMEGIHRPVITLSKFALLRQKKKEIYSSIYQIHNTRVSAIKYQRPDLSRCLSPPLYIHSSEAGVLAMGNQ